MAQTEEQLAQIFQEESHHDPGRHAGEYGRHECQQRLEFLRQRSGGGAATGDGKMPREFLDLSEYAKAGTTATTTCLCSIRRTT